MIINVYDKRRHSAALEKRSHSDWFFFSFLIFTITRITPCYDCCYCRTAPASFINAPVRVAPARTMMDCVLRALTPMNGKTTADPGAPKQPRWRVRRQSISDVWRARLAVVFARGSRLCVSRHQAEHVRTIVVR
jgi:hypothetical protein